MMYLHYSFKTPLSEGPRGKYFFMIIITICYTLRAQ